MLMISSFKVFDQIAVLTNGGPGTRGTATIAFEVVKTAFTEQRAGLASAMAGIMLIIIVIASSATLQLLQRRRSELLMRGSHILRPLVALVITGFFFLPLYVALVNAFKTSEEVVTRPLSLPLSPTLENIIGVLYRPDGLFWYGLYNSVVLTGTSIIITTVISAMTAHYLVRSDRLWGKIMLLVMLSGLTIPPAVIMVPLTRILGWMNLMSTLPGAILVNVGYYLPFAVFVFMGFMRSVPRELEEAAAIDGASRFRIFWQVVFPLIRPASASVLIFLGVWIWNDFLTPLLIPWPRQW